MKRKLLTAIPQGFSGSHYICEGRMVLYEPPFINPLLFHDFVTARSVYDCKSESYPRRAHIAYKSRLMLALPICDLRQQSERAIPLLMNNHGITIESISMEHIRYRGRVFIFPLASFFPPEIVRYTL